MTRFASSSARSAPARVNAVAFVGIAILSVQVAWLVTRTHGQVSKPLVACGAFAALVVMFRVEPARLFLGWLFLAPILQESASATHLGHIFALLLYTTPPIILMTQMLLAPLQGPRLSWVDAFPLAYVAYVFGSLLLTSSSLSDTPVGTVRSFYETVAMGPLVYYLLVFGPGRALTAARACGVLLAGCALQAVMSVLDFGISWNLWDDQGWRRPGQLARSVATLANPGLLGTFLGIGIVVSVAVLCWDGPPRLRRVSTIVLLVAPLGLVFTFTRGAILATVLVAGACLVLSPRTRLLGVGAALVSVVALVAIWPFVSSSSVVQTRLGDRQNVETRVVLQDISLHLAEKKPLTGWGYDAFDRVKTLVDVSAVNGAAYEQAIATTSHDTFLTVVVNYGAIGLALLLVPWCIILGGALRRGRAYADRWLLVASVGSIVLYAISAATFDLRFFSFVPMVPWLFLALLRRDPGTAGDRAAARS